MPDPRRLPTFVTPLLGRDEELARLATLPVTQTIVLYGPAGVGKTRLAVAHADRHQGARFVDATEVQTLEELALAVAASLDLRLRGTLDDWIDAIASHPASLLLVDGLDHPTAPMLDALRRCAATGRWVITSRTQVDLDGALQVEVPSLQETTAAAGLFEAAARQARPSYRVDDRERAAIVQVIDRLDRLPLAIELAGAWMDVMDAPALLEQLNGGASTPTRDSVLEHWVCASVERLSDAERRALCALTVLRGDFPIEAAAAVVDDPSPIERVRALRRHCLLQTEEYASGVRLRMPAAVRAVVEAAGGAVAEAEARHATFYAARSAGLAERMRGSEQLAIVADALTRDEPNLLAVLRRAVHGRVDLVHAFTVVAGLDVLTFERWPRDKTQRELAALLEAAGDSRGSALARVIRARALIDLCRAEDGLAELLRAESLAPDDDDILGLVARARSLAAHRDAKLPQARDFARDAVAHHVRSGDRHLQGIALTMLAETNRTLGEFDRAHEALDGAEVCFRGVGGRRKLGVVWGIRGALLAETGHPRAARDRCREAITVLDELGLARDAVLLRICLVYVLVLDDALSEARDVLARASTDARELSMMVEQGYLIGNAGLIAHVEGNIDEAVRLYHQAIAQFGSVGAAVHDPAFRGYLGTALLTQEGRTEEALSFLSEAVAGLERSGERSWATLFSAAELAARGGEEALQKLLLLEETSPDVAPMRALLERRLGLPQRPVARPSTGCIVPRLFSLALERSTALDARHRIASDGSWFTDEDKRVSLERRKSLRRVLARFVEARGAGQTLDAADLFRAGWPDEDVRHDSAMHRVHVAISALRAMGLRDSLQRWEDGYRLDPSVPITVVSAPPPV